MRAFAFALGLVCLPALADGHWEVIHQDSARVVEIDRASVRAHPDGSVWATGRLSYGTALAESRGFATLVASNRYDCAARSFAIVRRSYLDAAGRPADVEVTRMRGAMPVGPGSLDDRLLRAACAQVAEGRRPAPGSYAADPATQHTPEPARPAAARTATPAPDGAQSPAADALSGATAHRIAERLAAVLSGPGGQAIATDSSTARTIDVHVPDRAHPAPTLKADERELPRS